MRRREIPYGIRFVTFSCYQRLPLLSHPAIRDVFVRSLGDACERDRLQLFAWVIMPEHVHLLIRPPEGVTLGASLRSLKQSVGQRVVSRWRELRAPVLTRVTTPAGTIRFWQKGGGFDRNVRDETEFTKEVRYVHHNPVTRGLVDKPEDWEWSSVRWWMGDRDVKLTCSPPPGGAEAWAGWTGYV